MKHLKNKKKLILGAPMLHRPVSGAEYFIQTDAIETGLGLMVTQKVEGGERVLAFTSRVIHKNEKNYSVTEKECLSINGHVKSLGNILKLKNNLLLLTTVPYKI